MMLTSDGRRVRTTLTIDDVATIKHLYASGDYSQASLAALYKITSSGVRKIIRGQRWASVPPATRMAHPVVGCKCCGQIDIADCCRPVPESNTLRVDRLGNVWTCFRSRWANGRWRKCKVQDHGYYKVGFKTKQGQQFRSVHSLVLEVFVGERPSGHYGCHNDGNPKNNSLSNLRWATPRENQLDRNRHGRGPLGENNPQSKLTECQVREIRIRAQAGESRADLMKSYGLCAESVRKIIKRQSWKHII